MSTTEKLVTINRLKALLEAYGAAPECWPEEERAAATALLETSAEARILLDDAAALDSLLGKMPEPEISRALTSRVRSMALPASHARSTKLFFRLGTWLRPETRLGWQGAVAVAGVLGMVAGVGLTSLVHDSVAPMQPVIAAAPSAVPATSLANVAAITVPDGAVITISDGLDTGTASLSPNISAISLTGEDMAGTELDDTSRQSDADEISVAGIPLY